MTKALNVQLNFQICIILIPFRFPYHDYNLVQNSLLNFFMCIILIPLRYFIKMASLYIVFCARYTDGYFVQNVQLFILL